MADFLAVLFVLIFIAYGIIVIVYLALVWRFFSLLKSSQPDIYSMLGSPHLLLINTPITTWRFINFLFKKEFEKISDPQVVAEAKALRVLLVVGLTVTSGMFVIFFWIAYGNIAALK